MAFALTCIYCASAPILHSLLSYYPTAAIPMATPTIIIHLTHTNVWESIEKPCSCMQFIKSRIFLAASHAQTRDIFGIAWYSGDNYIAS